MAVMLRIIKKLMQYSHKERLAIVSYIILRALKATIAIIIPLINACVITNLLGGALGKLMRSILVLCICYVASLVISHIIKITENRLTKFIHYEVKRAFTTKLLSIPPSQLSFEQGRLISLILNDSSVVSSMVFTVISAFFSVFTVLGIGIVVLLMNWKLSLLLISTYPINIVINIIYSKKLKDRARSLLERNDDYISLLKNAIGNIIDVSVYGGTQKVSKELDKYNRGVCESSLLQGIIKANYSTSISGISMINHLLLTIVGIVFVYSGYISFGDFVAFNSYSKNLSSSIDMLINLNAIIQPGIVSIERLLLLEEQYERSLMLENAKQHFDSVIHSVKFDKVFFSSKTKDIISNVSLEIRAGEIVGIWGENASGKTTLANLLLTNITPTSGRIYINNYPSDTLTYNSIAHHISYVGTSKKLFNISIRDNILISYSDSTPEDDEVSKICAKLNLKVDIDCLPQKFDTIVSDNIKLSSGQIQKIQLARAILSRPDVLILDEAISNLDITTKGQIKEYLQQLKREGKLILLISHVPDDYSICDKIYRLEDGSVNLVSSLHG